MTEEEIRNQIDEYKKKVKYIQDKIVEINYTIRFGLVDNDTINKVDELKKNVDEILRLGDTILKNNTLDLSKIEIINYNNDLKKDFRNLKITLISRYNSDIKVITDKINVLSNNLKGHLEYNGDINHLKNIIPVYYTKRIRDYRMNISISYDFIEEYNKFINKLKENNINIPNDKVDKVFAKELELLQYNIAYLDHDIITLEHFSNNLTIDDVQNYINNYNGKIDELSIKLESIKDKIISDDYIYFSDVLISANEEISKLKKILNDTKFVHYTPLVKKEYNLYKNQILNMLDEMEYYKVNIMLPFKNNKDTNINSIINKKLELFENEIKEIENVIIKNKTFDNVMNDNLNALIYEARKKLLELSSIHNRNNINKENKKTLLVKSSKSADKFYKRHDKKVLTSIGLGAIALTHNMVGPVVVPSIMLGNSIMGRANSNLKKYEMESNKLLAKFINAKYDNDNYVLANGAKLNSITASSSLLKGIAIAGVDNIKMVSPTIQSMRKLVEKIKLKELKGNLINSSDSEDIKVRGR